MNSQEVKTQAEAQQVETGANHQVPAEAKTEEIKTESTLFAEPIFHISNFTVTNSLLNSWIVLAIIVLSSVVIRKKINNIPKGIQNYLEIIFDSALNLADSVTGSREKSLKFLPLVLPLFVFILLNNWLGLLPGVGSIGFVQTHGGENIFVPLLRGATADLNMTLALAIMAVILTHIFGVITTSAWSHLNRFVGIDLLLEIPKKVFKEKEYTAILVNPIKFFVGIIEIIGEFAKVASLSFRLFGNIFAGEVLLGAMAAIFAFILPIPFMFLEIIVGMIQALIFAMLTLVFLTVMTTGHNEEHAQEGA
ncbi:MAG: FoF1 ATP synthase subunit a [Candidatus Buchananbacteria bacterium]